MSALKKHPQRPGKGICEGVGAAHTLTYTSPPLAVALFSEYSGMYLGTRVATSFDHEYSNDY
jgi:hypothetical protein